MKTFDEWKAEASMVEKALKILFEAMTPEERATTCMCGDEMPASPLSCNQTGAPCTSVADYSANNPGYLDSARKS
jgi:hypothetical protein